MKKWANILIVALFVASFVFAFGVVNSMVSLKYETNSSGECISTITGADLCSAIEFNKTAAKASLFFALVALFYRLYFMKNKKTE
ncbi:hypothetical protein H9Q13_09935 [Pontibacter sp. JH31]|uniref:Uncharacterized protein n=1 Tax=Pontibacter aquaedesilientis TaxID=2766980 RepID=A0ABR7XHP7_9BACT|nr:hypothetical protein [Pontibacter aquaedesilientis]MBD1397486.1 hypothetical protein [Pontibacter aquaedesilientis]